MYIDELYTNIDIWNSSRKLRGKEPRDDFGYIFQNIKMVKPGYSVLQTMIKDCSEVYYKNKGFHGNDLNVMIKNVTFETIRNSRKVYLLANGFSINDIMRICDEKNYMSTYRFNNLVLILYPEKGLASTIPKDDY